MFFKAAAVCMGMMMSVALTACGDDEEAAAPVPANRVETVTVAYDVDLSENPSISIRDLYYTLARNTTGSHATIYNVEHYGNMFRNSLDEFLLSR